MSAMKALVLGESDCLIEAVPSLLSRAGFSVCLLTTNPSLRQCKFVDRFLHAGSSDEAVQWAREEAKGSYDLIVIGDEETIRKIKKSDLSVEEKLTLLPVDHAHGFEHLDSKIGLSRVLKSGNIMTPDFEIAHNPAELESGCKAVGFPLLVKLDSSSGGVGVYHCNSDDDVIKIADRIKYPVLIQKKIEGNIIDLSGFFRDGRLIYFSYAEVIKADRNGYGPSSVRKYRNVRSLNPVVFEILQKLGMSLHAHGFVNISCVISRNDSKLHFFEADMRPNVWIEYPKYFDEDPAIAIRDYFLSGKTCVPHPSPRSPQEVMLGYAPRMKYIDFLTNKYRCRDSYENYLGRNFLFDRFIKRHLLRFVKPYVPASAWLFLKRSGGRVVYGR